MSLQDPAALSSECAEQSNPFSLVVLYRSFPVEIFMNAWERADSCMILVVLSVHMLGLGEDALNSASNWLRILPVKGHPGCLFPGRSFIFVNGESGTTKVPAAEGHPPHRRVHTDWRQLYILWGSFSSWNPTKSQPGSTFSVDTRSLHFPHLLLLSTEGNFDLSPYFFPCSQ